MSSGGRIISLVSGGLDSLALMYALAYEHRDLAFQPLYFRHRMSGAYWQREEGSNKAVWGAYHERFPNVLEPTYYDGAEIKVSRGRNNYRNQIFLDTVVRLFGRDEVVGVSIGVVPSVPGEWWVHPWGHPEPEDGSPSYLQEYLGRSKPEWKLYTFADFSSDGLRMNDRRNRVALGVGVLGEDWLWMTSSCFAPWAGSYPHVLTPRGRSKRMDRVAVGEKLLAVDDDGNLGETEVKSILKRQAQETLLIHIEGRTFNVTPEHPFYVCNRGWKRACELAPGDELFYVSGRDKMSWRLRRYNPMSDPKSRQKHLESESHRQSRKGSLHPCEICGLLTRNRRFCSHACSNSRPRPYVSGNREPRNYGTWGAAGTEGYRSELEYHVDCILQEYGLPTVYTGNGALWLDHKNPDFEVLGQKKVIEVYMPNDPRRKRDPNYAQRRGEEYKVLGYKVLFLPVSDRTKLNKEEIASKVRAFTSNGKKVLSISRLFQSQEVLNFECEPFNNFITDGILVHNCQKWFTGTRPGIYSYLGEGIQATGGCGDCYSDVERSMAIRSVLGYDKTPYRRNPMNSKWWLQYAVAWRNFDLFLGGLPYSRDGTVRRELRSWLGRRLECLSQG